MSELVKTVLFVLGAIVAVGSAFLTNTRNVEVDVPENIGESLFPDFTDPFAAKSLEVVEYNDDEGRVDEFAVQQKQGAWVIPSHLDYPADAQDNLTAAATLLTDLKVVGVQTDDREAHATYGLLEPSKDGSSEGVGRIVRMKDDKGSRLADLVIGLPVKGNDSQRFVRIPGQDRVYVVEIDPSKLSTKFEDWVDRDVLQLESFDIESMRIRDYSTNIVPTQDGMLSVDHEERLEMQVDWNADDFKWDLAQLDEYRSGEMRPTELLPTEEVDKTRLDEMKSELAGLKIVDVGRKPAGLSAELKAESEFWKDRAAVSSLVNHGFYPSRNEGGELLMLSSNGEVEILHKDAVTYRLRFGQIAGTESSDVNKVNRYMMVTAMVDEDRLPEPELEPVPGADEPAGAAEAGSETESDSETEAADGESGTPGEGEKAADGTEGDTETEVSAEEKQQDEERDRIIKENQRKTDEHNEKRKKAEDKVKELNLRFADWYYVIPEDVYKKIHLARADVIKEKEGSVDEGFGVDSFRQLEDEGLQREEAPPASS